VRHVLDKLPNRLQELAQARLRQVMDAETESAAEAVRDTFVAEFETQYSKAVTCL